MLQIWQWISTGTMILGYADKGIDCPITVNNDIGIMLMDMRGNTLMYIKQGELRQLANFMGYKTNA